MLGLPVANPRCRSTSILGRFIPDETAAIDGLVSS